MLSEQMKTRIAESAKRHFDENVSMAAFIYKRVDDVSGPEAAQEVSDFYVAEQRRLMAELETEADATAYQRSIEE